MIRSLRIKAYRNIPDAEMDLSRANIFVGGSGQGKSSIIEAARFALTGRNQWTDLRGQGLDTQVRSGEKKARVELTLERDGNILEVMRTIPASPGVDALQASINAFLGVPQAMVAAQMETRRFFRLDAKDQQALLQSLLAADLTMERLFAEMDKEQAGLGAWFGRQVEADTGAGSIKDFAEAGRKAAKKLRDKTAGELEVKAKAAASEEQPPTQEHLDFLQRKVEDLAAQIGRAEGENAGACDLAESRMREYTTRMQQHDQAVAALNAAKHAVKVAQADVDGMAHPERGSDAIEEDLAKAIERLREAQGEENAAIQAMSAIPDGPCPAGTCLRASTAAALEKVNAAKKIADDADLVVVDLRRQQAAAARQEEAIANALARQDNANRALGTAKKALDAMPVPPQKPDAAPPGPDLSALRDQKRKTEEALMGARAAQMRAQAAERARAEVTKLQQDHAAQAREAERWEAAVAAVGPAGIKARLMEKEMAGLAREVAALTRDFFAMDFRIQAEPWLLEARIGDGWIPVSQVSWSQKAALSACLQAVLARRSGFKLIVIDEAGADSGMRAAMLTMLEELTDLQAFFLVTSDQRPPVEPGDEDAGLRWWYVEGGQVERIREEVAVGG